MLRTRGNRGISTSPGITGSTHATISRNQRPSLGRHCGRSIKRTSTRRERSTLRINRTYTAGLRNVGRDEVPCFTRKTSYEPRGSSYRMRVIFTSQLAIVIRNFRRCSPRKLDVYRYVAFHPGVYHSEAVVPRDIFTRVLFLHFLLDGHPLR